MADELRKAFNVESKLVRGGGGIFDVIVDGKKVYSKFQTGRFPTPEEIIQKLKP
ncbi:Rdx family protein [candidate division KSB1 bacterium]|nr:Rdx family protein [candidate division KSB1 bacterium]